MSKRKLNFSQRMGLVDVEDAIVRESIPQMLRQEILKYLDSLFLPKTSMNQLNPDMQHFVTDCQIKVLNKDYSSVPWSYRAFFANFSAYIENIDWNHVFDSLEFIIHHQTFRSLDIIICSVFNSMFEEYNLAYRFINFEIHEISDSNEIESITQTFTLQDNLSNARTHIKSAIKLISVTGERDYRNSIKESISAVELVCRKYTEENSLGKALSKMKSEGKIESQVMIEAMNKLYQYSNGADGIRHAIMDASKPPDYHDAKYVLVLCSAFINYVVGKYI